MIGLDVICPTCRKSYHETTKAFNPHRPPNGAMVRLKDPWRKWGWCTFGDAGNGLAPNIAERKETYHTLMECPGCCSPMAPSSRLLVRHSDGSEFVPEPEPIPIDNTVDGKLVIDPDYSALEAEWEARMPQSAVKDGKLTCGNCGKQYENTDKGRPWYEKHVETCKEKK